MTEFAPPLARPARALPGDGRPVATESLLSEVLRGWRLIALAVLVCLGLGALYAYRIAAPVYRTHALVAINSQQREVIRVELVLPALTRDAQVLNTQVELVRSRALVARVVDELDLVRDPEFNPALKARDGLRARARAAAERLGLIRPRADPFVVRGAVVTATVNTLMRRLEITVEPETLVLSVALGSNDADKSARIVNQLVTLYVAGQVAQKQEATASAAAWLADRVAGLETELKLAEARAEIWGARDGNQTGERLSDSERRLEALNALDPVSHAPAILALQGEIETLSADLALGRQLDREVDVLKVQHDLFKARLKETTLLDGSLTPDARVVSPAIVPLYPASPKPTLILGLALIVGLTGGTALVLAWAEVRPGYGSRAAMEADLGLPVLATLPQRDSRAEVAAAGRLARRLGGLDGGLALSPAPGLSAPARWLRDRLDGAGGIGAELDTDWPLAAAPAALTLLVLSERTRVSAARRMAARLHLAGARRSAIVLLTRGRKVPAAWSAAGG